MPPEKQKTLRYNHQTFRPEAVEAYTTRQAGEPWDARHRFENCVIVALSILAAFALALLFMGGR